MLVPICRGLAHELGEEEIAKVRGFITKQLGEEWLGQPCIRLDAPTAPVLARFAAWQPFDCIVLLYFRFYSLAPNKVGVCRNVIVSVSDSEFTIVGSRDIAAATARHVR
jgi:hypothetical protein